MSGPDPVVIPIAPTSARPVVNVHGGTAQVVLADGTAAEVPAVALARRIDVLEEENADLRAEVTVLRMDKERLQGALRRAAADLDSKVEEIGADLRVRAAALRHEAERGSAALL